MPQVQLFAPAGSRRGIRRGSASRKFMESLESRLLMHNHGLAGYVYCDDNGNGVKDAGDEPLAGVHVTLTGTDLNGQPVNQTTTTDANGAYIFIKLLSGTYKLSESAPSDYSGVTDETANIGGLYGGSAVASPGMISNIVINGTDANFGRTGFGFNFAEHCTPCPMTPITSDFNGTGINAGNTIWFNSVLKPSGLSTTAPTTVMFSDQMILFSVNGTGYSLPVPDAIVTFTPGATTSSTIFDAANNVWRTSVPTNTSGNDFLSGLGYKVPSFIPGGAVKNITWTGDFDATKSGVTVNWQWAAAVYTQFAGNNAIGVKPLDDNHFGPYFNSDHAGTPENERPYVIGGARGGGGSNFTGSYSATGHGSACLPPMPQPAVAPGISIDAGGTGAGSFVADTDFVGGFTASFASPIDTSGVTNPAPQSVYQHERFGAFTYKVGGLTPGAAYVLRLDFCENAKTAVGQRIFDVDVNGDRLLENFDVFAAAGGAHKALAETFGAKADASGNITIDFYGALPGMNAQVNGIEITAL